MPVYIPSGTDLISEENLEEAAEKELEILLGRTKRGDFQSRSEITRKVEREFIPVVEDIIKKLENEKRSAESLIYQKLQETQILIRLLENIDSIKTRKELGGLRKLLKEFYLMQESKRKVEIRLGRGKKIPGFFVQKAKGSIRRYASVIGIRAEVQKRSGEELAGIGNIKNLVQELQLNPTKKVSKEFEGLLISTVKSLRQDFEDLLTLEIDADIEEGLKLKKVRAMIRLLKMLKIKEPIPRLQVLENKCKVWVQQDQRSQVQIEILVRKLEEIASQSASMKKIKGNVTFKLIINPTDPDFAEWYEHCYLKMPDARNDDGSLSDEYESIYKLRQDMTKRRWFCVVAKLNNKILAGIHFGYYALPSWKAVIGYSGYNAVRPGFKDRAIGPKLARLSEYYLRKIASQEGYRFLMVVRFIHERIKLPRRPHDKRAAKYLKKIRARRLAMEGHYVEDHEFYMRLLGEWKKRKFIPKELLMDFLRAITPDLYGTEADDDDDFNALKESLKGTDKILLEEVNVS